VGITSQLLARVWQHKNKWYEGSFTARYRFDMLVYFEAFSHPSEAITGEKEIKGWRREKKLRLILAVNPDWADLSEEWVEAESWRAIPEAKLRPVLRRRSGKD
jgi:putative endonuclease